MPPIAKTLLATSLPVNLCQGFALFPALGTARAGLTLNTKGNKIVDIPETTILAFRVSLSASVSLFLGVCGPSYGIALFAEGSYTASQMSLKITDDDTQAGFIFGVDLQFKLNATARVITYQWLEDGWNSRIRSTWSQALEANFDIKLDIIGLVLKFILGKLAKDNKGGIANGIKNVGSVLPVLGSYAIFGDSSTTTIANTGRVTVRPRLNIPINIVPLLKKIPKVGEVLTALKKVKIEPSFGPQISLTIPVTVRIIGFGVDNATYQNGLTWDGKGNVVAGYSSGTVPASAKLIDMALTNAIDSRFGVEFGVFFNLKIIKIISIGASYLFDVSEVLNIVPDLEAHLNTLEATVGVTHPSGMGRIPAPEDDIEVVFEPEGFPLVETLEARA